MGAGRRMAGARLERWPGGSENVRPCSLRFIPSTVKSQVRVSTTFWFKHEHIWWIPRDGERLDC